MQLWHFQSSVSVFILRNTVVLYMVCSLSKAQTCLWKLCHQKQPVTRSAFNSTKIFQLRNLSNKVFHFSVLHLRIHNLSQWQRVTFRLTTRSHVRLIEITVSKLWFEGNKMFSYTSLHSHDLNINSPHSLWYFAYSVSSENMVLNQTISPSWFFPDSHHLSAMILEKLFIGHSWEWKGYSQLFIHPFSGLFGTNIVTNS